MVAYQDRIAALAYLLDRDGVVSEAAVMATATGKLAVVVALWQWFTSIRAPRNTPALRLLRSSADWSEMALPRLLGSQICLAASIASRSTT